MLKVLQVVESGKELNELFGGGLAELILTKDDTW